jgi:hypothetical protein
MNELSNDSDNENEFFLSMVEEKPEALRALPPHLRTRELCFRALLHPNGFDKAWHHVPDQYKTPTLCEQAILKDAEALLHVPAHILTSAFCERLLTINPTIVMTNELAKKIIDKALQKK